MNAKGELLKVLKRYDAGILCAEIKYKDKIFQLGTNHSTTELTEFFNKLDFEYHISYLPELSGMVWLDDDSWLEKDNLEWQIKSYPTIPDKLMVI